MTLPRLYALNDYWAEHPPVHFMAAAIGGYKGNGKRTRGGKDMSPSELAELGFAVEGQLAPKDGGTPADDSLAGLISDLSMEGFAIPHMTTMGKE